MRSTNRDPEVNDKVAPAQRAAIAKWATPRERPYEYLKSIKQPTLVVNGSNDVIIYTANSYILQQNLPNAELIIYPDSAHGSHHQRDRVQVERQIEELRVALAVREHRELLQLAARRQAIASEERDQRGARVSR